MSTRMDFVVDAKDRASRVFRNVAAASSRMSSQMQRSFGQTDRALGQFVRGADGKLRDMKGRFVSESRAAGNGLFRGISMGILRLQTLLDGLKLANIASMRAGLVALGAQALPFILALGAALANVAPAALLAVPALAGLVASMTAAKLATHGVKDAFAAAASGDAKEFAEALKKLSPAARRFVRDGAKMIPALRAMRTAIQETLFAKIPAGTLSDIGKNLLPTLRRGLVGVSSSLGTAAAQLAAFMKSGRARGDLAATFVSITAALRPLERVPATLAKAFGRLSATAAPFLVKLTSGLGRGLDSMSARIDKAAASGKLTASIQSALDTLAQLGRIAGNVGRAIGGLFKGSENSSLVDSIERITKSIADAVNSERGQQVIAKVFEVISKAAPVIAVASGLTWAITGIATALAAVASPAAAVAGVVLATAAGFALLYNKSAALREIVAGVGGKLRELWDLFAAKGLPILKDFAQNALATAISGFEHVRDAIQRNRPELEQLWMVVKKVAEVFISHWPRAAATAVTMLKLIFSGISHTIDMIGAAVRGFNLFGGAILGVFRTILGGAVSAFGWIPGIGDKLRDAQTKFESFAAKTTYSIKTIPDTLALKVSTPGSVNAQLELSKLQIGLAALKDKVIGLTTRGVPVTAADLNSIKAKAEALERTYTLRVRVDGGSAAAASLNAVKAAAERMERVYTVTTLRREEYAAGNKPPQRAMGGPVRAGHPYIVGERRPELFVPNQSGRIVPRVPTGSGGATGGARVVHLTVNANLNGQVITDFIKKTVSIDGGGNVQAAFG